MGLAEAKMHEKSETEFHANIIAYIKGGAHDLKEGTVGMGMAYVAKKLIAEHPQLGLAENKVELMDTIRRIYYADTEVTLSEREFKVAKLALTHEDDLPQA